VIGQRGLDIDPPKDGMTNMRAANLQVILKSRPEGIPNPEDFALVEGPIPQPGPDQILVENLFLSLDPYMGSAIKGRHLSGAVREGDVMVGETVGRVVQSRHPDFAAGDLVGCRGGWQTYALADGPSAKPPALAAIANAARKLPSHSGISPSLYLGALGMPGLTAYAATVFLGEIKPGQTFVTMAASGGVGSAAGQIARIMGARAVGIAGSDEKCAAATDLFGFEACVNYKTEGWREALAAACPDGVDCYLDSSGGKILEAVLLRLAMNARVILCGMMDQYNSPVPLPGPNLGMVIGKRAVMKGLVVYDFFDKMDEYRRHAARWLQEGRLKAKEDMTEGLEGAPAAFSRLMAGGNFGKAVVRVAD
jgi:NADPH-dependent curcumin reductase CurA